MVSFVNCFSWTLLCREIYFLFPLEQAWARRRVFCVVPGRAGTSSQTELSSSPPHPASPSEAHGKLEGWDAGEERTFLNLAGAARQPRTRTLNKHFTDILILILSCWPLPFIHEDVKRWAYWPRILQYGIKFQSEVCCVPKQMEISQQALMRRLLCAGRQGIGSAKMNWTRPSSDWPAGEKDEKSPPIQGSVAGPPGPA